jgi:hypothetical protein
MSVQFSRHGMAAVPLAASVPKSSFVRQLLNTRDDPAKARVLASLLDIEDAQLLGFGLTPEDIALLRRVARQEGQSVDATALTRRGTSAWGWIPAATFR